MAETRPGNDLIKKRDLNRLAQQRHRKKLQRELQHMILDKEFLLLDRKDLMAEKEHLILEHQKMTAIVDKVMAAADANNMGLIHETLQSVRFPSVTKADVPGAHIGGGFGRFADDRLCPPTRPGNIVKEDQNSKPVCEPRHATNIGTKAYPKPDTLCRIEGDATIVTEGLANMESAIQHNSTLLGRMEERLASILEGQTAASQSRIGKNTRGSTHKSVQYPTRKSISRACKR